MNESLKLRRVAAHHIIVDGEDVGQCVVLSSPDGTVLDVHPLTHEEPFTEWLGGTLIIKKGILR